jgi:hypothetical protein
MRTSSASVLGRLLAATPLPPITEDADELIETYLKMEEGRRAILAELPADPSLVRESIDRPIVLELLARQEAWRTAISGVQLKLRGQQLAVRQLRSYATSGG